MKKARPSAIAGLADIEWQEILPKFILFRAVVSL